MEEKKDAVVDFFNQLWTFATNKHNQGVYNTVCLVVLLALPLLVLVTTFVVCCHCCCCRHGNNCCCCGQRAASAKSETKKKKSGTDAEDLWISVKAGPMTPDRVPLAMM